VLFKSNYTKI